METALFALLGLALIASVSRELHERHVERLERLNREDFQTTRSMTFSACVRGTKSEISQYYSAPDGQPGRRTRGTVRGRSLLS
jgi:hypothetical protein